MTAYRRGHDASLARYNARKRELRASMLEYSEHMHQIQAHASLSSRLKSRDAPDTSLEIRAQGHLFNRYHDRSLLRNRLSQLRRPGKRPSSLDEKELQLNSRIQQEPKRDTKSERPPITIPTALPPLVNPPNTPDFHRKGDARVSFVSASDLYDLVDFGTTTKTPRKYSTRISNVNEGIKLIEDIELQRQRERNIAWEKHPNANTNGRENSPSRDVSPSRDTSPPRDTSPTKVKDIDVLTGKRIQRKTLSSISKEPMNITAVQKLKGIQENIEKEKSDPDSDTEGIVPLNLLLEHAAVRHLRAKRKVHPRPKRAKRMQLHKSNLVVIPEDGGTFVSPGDTQSSSSGESEKTLQLKTSDATSKSSSLTSSPLISKAFKVSQNSNSVISTTPRPRHDSPFRNNNNDKSHCSQLQKPSNVSPHEEKNRKAILKRSVQGGNETTNEGTQLPDLIVTNSVYPPLPWEKNLDSERDRVKHVTFDTNISREKAKRRVKRLIYLQDQPEEYYKLEL